MTRTVTFPLKGKEIQRRFETMKQREETTDDRKVVAKALAALETLQRLADHGYNRVMVQNEAGDVRVVDVGSVGV